MDCSFKFLMKKIFKRRRGKLNNVIPRDEVATSNDKVHWSRLHLPILRHYFHNISQTCDFGESPCAVLLSHFESLAWRSSPELIVPARKAASLIQVSRHVFMVPRLMMKFQESKNHRIKKHQLVEVFISLLLRLLCHKTDLIVNPYKDRFNKLEKELRFLHTILVDTSFMLCDDEHEQVWNLLEEFEAVANEAGILVHSLLFSTDRGMFRKICKGLGVVLNHIDLMKANIMKFLYLWPSISISITSMTPKTSVVNSFLIVNSLSYDLQDLMNQDDNSIADVKDQIKTLHQGLTLLQSSIKDVRLPQPSEIGELKELLMRIGDMAHQAEYLIIPFLVGDTPLWYLINRLTDINHKIRIIGTDVLEIIKKYKTGGTAQLPLQAKRNWWEVDNVTFGFEDKAIHILDQLVGGTERLQVISIFGMPGLGKTTLAKKLYDHSSVKYSFHKLSWCVVSQIYQRKSTMTDILIQIASELEKDRILEMEEERLAEHIYKTLKGRRYIIVMDDIWDSNVWDDLLRCFPDNRNGSRILFTTRNKDVGST